MRAPLTITKSLPSQYVWKRSMMRSQISSSWPSAYKCSASSTVMPTCASNGTCAKPLGENLLVPRMNASFGSACSPNESRRK